MSRNKLISARRSIPQRKSVRQITNIDGKPKFSLSGPRLRNALKALADNIRSSDQYQPDDPVETTPTIGRTSVLCPPSGYNYSQPKRNRRRKK